MKLRTDDTCAKALGVWSIIVVYVNDVALQILSALIVHE